MSVSIHDRRLGFARALPLALVVVAAACGGGASPVGSSGPGASPAPSSAGTAAPASAATGGGAAGAPCQRVTLADVEAAFGGTVGVGVEGESDCTFDVSGALKAGTVTPPGPFLVAVTYQDDFVPFDTAKTLFGDSVRPADGVGTDAYFAIGTLRARISSGSLVVTAIGLGSLDEAKLDASMIALAKALVARD